MTPHQSVICAQNFDTQIWCHYNTLVFTVYCDINILYNHYSELDVNVYLILDFQKPVQSTTPVRRGSPHFTFGHYM